ncbi:MAG: GNAT family N-acetyltransferase [Terracidiphilus sp.]
MTHKKGHEPAAGVRFREAVAADRPRLIALINSAFAIETFLEGTRTDEDRLAAMMAKGSILVAEAADGLVLGSVYMERRGARGYLGMLAVDPTHQGQGLARRLIAAAEDRFRSQGCEAIDIVVLSLRPELPPIYRRFGYIQTGTEPFKPSRPLRPGQECHGIVLSKKL